jgi:hypothetical protein
VVSFLLRDHLFSVEMSHALHIEHSFHSPFLCHHLSSSNGSVADVDVLRSSPSRKNSLYNSTVQAFESDHRKQRESDRLQHSQPGITTVLAVSTLASETITMRFCSAWYFLALVGSYPSAEAFAPSVRSAVVRTRLLLLMVGWLVGFALFYWLLVGS